MAQSLFGSIRTRGKNRYLGRYRIRGRDYYTPTRQTKAEVRRDLARISEAISTGKWVPVSGRVPADQNITFSDWSTQWQKDLEDQGKSPNTLRSYKSHLKAHIEPWCKGRALREITSTDIEGLHADLIRRGKSALTARNAVRVFTSCLQGAVDAGLLTERPRTGRTSMASSKSAREPVALTREQLVSLVAACAPVYRGAIALAGWCGLRYGEIAALTVGDVDLDAGTVTVSKAVKRAPNGAMVLGPPKSQAGYRTLSIPAACLEVLAENPRLYERGGTLALPSLYGSYLKDSTLRRVLNEAAAKVGLPRLRFHDLRHTALTLYGQAGATLADLMYRAGHSDVDTVLIYQHSTRDRDKELAARL